MVLLLSSGLGSFWYFGGFWSRIFSATSYSAFYILPVVCLHFPECDVFNVLSSACVLWKSSASEVSSESISVSAYDAGSDWM